jgi:ApeA N-terminal domain 1
MNIIKVNMLKQSVDQLSVFFTDDPRVVLVNLQDIKSNFQLYMDKWFEKSKLLQPVIDLYLNTLNYKEMSIERHFLNLVQALESYHIRTRNNYVTEPKKHRLKIQTILDSVPEEYRSWLRERLNFSHEPTLQDSSLDLVSDKEDIFLFFNGYEEAKSFIKKVKHTRNYHTHYDLKLEKKALKGEELNFVCLILRSMVEYFLLQELDLPKETIHQKMRTQTRRIRDIQTILEYRKNEK